MADKLYFCRKIHSGVSGIFHGYFTLKTSLKQSKHMAVHVFMTLLLSDYVTFTVKMAINTLSPRQHGRHFPDDIFKCIFLNENVWIPNKISLRFVPKGSINNIPALVQIMAWRRPGDKPLSEPMMVSLLTHICVTWPQWVKSSDGIFLELRYWPLDITVNNKFRK